MRTTNYSEEMVDSCHHPRCWDEYFGNGKITKEASAMSPKDELDEVKKDLRLVKEENLKLQAVITDVTEVNKRWQKYNNDRQMYVERLLSTIQDQQEQMNKNIEKRLLMTKEGENAGDEARQLYSENAKLRDEIGQLQSRTECMEREHKEHVEVLEIQVRANKDDWEAEKREKELARQEIERLEAKVQELQEELNSCKLQLREEKSSYQRKHCCCAGDARESHCSSHITICRKNSFPGLRTSVHVPHGHLIPRGSTIYLGDDLVIDGDSTSSKPAQAQEVGAQQGTQPVPAKDSGSSSSPVDKKLQKTGSEPRIEPSSPKNKMDSQEKGTLNIPSASAVSQSKSSSSAPSLFIASVGGSKVEHLTPVNKEVTASAKDLLLPSLLATSTAATLPPLLTSFSDTVVPDRAQKAYKDSWWNLKTSDVSSKTSANTKEIAENSKPIKSHNVVPNVTAVDDFEEYTDGVLTQTRDDVICPGCGRVFHPEIHMQFLKHFGECQSKNKASKSCTLKTRN